MDWRHGQEVSDDRNVVGKGETQIQRGPQVSDLVPGWIMGRGTEVRNAGKGNKSGREMLMIANIY